MAIEKILNARVQLKADTPENWAKAINFIPKDNEPIIYKSDLTNPLRIKIGDGLTSVNELPFLNISSDYIICNEDNLLLSTILESYILNIDYNILAFDTSEIVIGTTSTTSVLGQAILGQMVLA